MGSEEQNKLQEKQRVVEKPTPFLVKGKADISMHFIKTRVFSAEGR